MVERVVSGAVVAVTGAIAVLCLVWWLERDLPFSLEERVALDPGGGESEPFGAELEVVDIQGQFLRFDGVPSALGGAWPSFRGVNFDNVSRDDTRLADAWPQGGPPVLWAVELGEGHAGPAVRNGRVYVLDYDEVEEGDALRCFSLDDGAEIWRRWYQTRAKRNHGISRTVPAVTDEYVVTVGPKCHVLCVDALSGEFRWGIDLVRELGTKEPLWFTAQCPLIDGSLAILAPGGRTLMIAVDCRSGEIAWETPNPRGWEMSHTSIVPMTFRGRKMYVYCALGGMVGVAADGEDAGAVLWETTEWNHSVVAPSPVVLEDGRILVTAGYGAGSAVFQLAEEAGAIVATLLYRLDRKVFACEQQTPVYYNEHLFTVLPKDAGGLREQFVCMRPDGEVVWTSGKEHRFGLGPFLIGDDKVFILKDDGMLTMIRADTSGYFELGRAKLLDGRDAWAPMALVDGRLLLRDSKRMICVDLRPSTRAAMPRAAGGRL
jgi:outer membrane protein assembly factor BamB